MSEPEVAQRLRAAPEGPLPSGTTGTPGLSDLEPSVREGSSLGAPTPIGSSQLNGHQLPVVAASGLEDCVPSLTGCRCTAPARPVDVADKPAGISTVEDLGRVRRSPTGAVGSRVGAGAQHDGGS